MSNNEQPRGTKLQDFIAEEVGKVKDVYCPVKAGMLRRILITKAPIEKLHPNPDDEFCMPAIGPNMEIVSKYQREFQQLKGNKDAGMFSDITADKPLQVQKITPDGYLILNGHHRWAGAHLAGVPKLNIRILDLTQKKDIERALRASKHDRRVTVDLDEIVFSPDGDDGFEPLLNLWLRRLYKNRIRIGIPALFRFLSQIGYDVWVYTANYYSSDYLHYLFKHYHCPVTGVVTGTGRKGPAQTDLKKYLDKVFQESYQSTLHIDNDSVLQTFTKSRDFRDVPLETNGGRWFQSVMNTVRKMEAEEAGK